MTRFYHRPVDFLEGIASLRALDAGEALPLAGGNVSFRSVEVMDRSAVGEIIPVTEWKKSGHSIHEKITGTRTSIAGLPIDRSLVMGVLNVTPDSFSDGGDFDQGAALLSRARQLAGEGADIWDVGGESTRPGSNAISIDEELARVLPAVRALSQEGTLPISIDSRKPEVFEQAIKAGARIINDVSALTWSEQSLKIAAKAEMPIVLMHALGDPKTMQDEPRYDNVLLDVYDWLEDRIEACVSAGIDRSSLIVDPGIGFGKTVDHNLALFGGLSLFHGLGCPVMLGASRKSFIHKLHPSKDPKGRLGGSLAAVLAGRAQGVQIFRVHDVHHTVEALATAEAIARAN